MMMRWIGLFFACLLVLGLGVQPVSASDSAETPQAGAILCLPNVALAEMPDCLPLGAAAYAQQLAAKGITLPVRPLPAAQADPALAVVNFSYARLKDNVDTPVYASLDDAKAGLNPTRYIAHGPLRFISYMETYTPPDSDKPRYFRLRSDGWVTADSVSSRVGAVPGFQGLVFSRTPSNAFGWIIPFNPTAETQRTPGLLQNDPTGNTYTEYSLVQVYDVQTVDGADWVMIGPDEWLEARLVGRVTPRTTPPEGVTGSRWIEVNLEQQTLAVYDQGQMVFATMIATGIEPFWTRPGLFQVREKLAETVMRGAFEADQSDFYYLEDVPWTMYFDDARALHAAYWRARFGFPQSHGCVNLSPGDAHWLFDWAQVGDQVYVWDPSGKTPTDPSLYTSGAP
jgi:hypothetical protein